MTLELITTQHKIYSEYVCQLITNWVALSKITG